MLAEAPSPGAVRDAATEVFSRAEFERHRTLLERIAEWFAKLFRGREPRMGQLNAPSGGSALGELLLYLLLAAAVVVAVWLVVRTLRTRRVKRVEHELDDDPLVEEERAAVEWRSDAERAEAEGRWKDAMRDRYRELVAELVERRVLPDVAGRTTGELRLDMAAHAPVAAEPFSEACLLFELPWYADVATGPDENARLRALTNEVLTATARIEAPRAATADDDAAVIV